MTHTGGSATREVANVKASNLVLDDRHSIKSSARIKIESGTSIPSAVAVLPLTTNSELRRPHDRQLGRRGAFENASGRDTRLMIHFILEQRR